MEGKIPLQLKPQTKQKTQNLYSTLNPNSMETPIPTTTHEPPYQTVFIDTSLNTHLALLLSDSDTVFHLKKRIVAEHALCFPDFGEIRVHALKVKRRGCFYHLSESMYVKSAFHGVTKCWFISVDVSCVRDCIGNDRENDNDHLVSVPESVMVAQVGYRNDDPKRLLKGCSSSLHVDENERKLILGSDGVDGGSKQGSGEIGHVDSCKGKKEEKDIEKVELRGVDDGGEEGKLENGLGNAQDRLLGGKAEEMGSDKKRQHRSKKQSRNLVEDLLVENTIRECCDKGVELVQDELMHEGNKNIADEHCINAVSDANKRSDALFESNAGPAGGSNEQKNHLSKIKVGDCGAEDLSHLQAASKKKHRREKKQGDESSVKEVRTMITDNKEETLVHRDENDQQSALGMDGIDGGGKLVNGEISATASRKRKKEDQDIEKAEVHKTENEGKEGNLDQVLEERAKETGFDRKKRHKSKKKHTISVEGLPLGNTFQECSKSGAELCKDEQVHIANEGISNGDFINATSDACKSSDTLLQKVDGLAGVSNGDKNITSSLLPATKKKHKREKKRGDENSVGEDRTLDPDYEKEKLGRPTNVERPTNMEPLSEEKNKNSSHSPEKNENARIQSALPSGGKRKGKNKLLKPVMEETYHATDTKGSKDLNEETNAAAVPGKHVHGLPPSDPYAGKGMLSDTVHESNDKSSSRGISTNDIHLRNANNRHNAPEQETSCSAERVKSSMDDDAIRSGMHPDVLTQEPNDRDEDTLASGVEIVTHNQEEREKSASICPSTLQVEKNNLLVAEEECMKSKEAKSKLAENSELGNVRKSSKKRKNVNRNKDLSNGEQLTIARENAEVSLNVVSLTEARKYKDNFDRIVADVESNMHPKKRKEIPEVDAGSTSGLVTDREINDVIQNVVESVNKITETFIETENVDWKSRKKSKKRRGSQKNYLPELPTENGHVFHKNRSKEADSTSKMLKGGNDYALQNGTLATQLNSVSFENSELPPQKLKVDDDGSRLQASCENNRINSDNCFVPSQINHEIVAIRKVPIDKATELEGANGEPKAKKKKKNVDVHPLPEVKMSNPTVNENQKEKPQPIGSSSNIEPASSFSNAKDKPVKPSEISGGGVRAVSSNKSDERKSDPDEARKRDAAKLSVGGRSNIDKEAGTASVSSLESSRISKSSYKNVHGHQSEQKRNNSFNKKAAIDNSGEFMSRLQHGNRLIGTPGAIIKGDISRVPADEYSSDSSGATTKTPSDDSSSADYSDGESSTDTSSSQSGSSSLKGKGGGRKNSKLLSSGMSLDAILRSSKRYKKAKLTASQSQLEDTESQPVDFVPESQPIY